VSEEFPEPGEDDLNVTDDDEDFSEEDDELDLDDEPDLGE
jgi:hypothetical protein